MERPREKFQEKGAAVLSDIELLAVLLGSGTKKHDVMAVAGRILKVLDAGNEKLSLGEFRKIEGVGPAKAALIAAAPADVLPLISYFADRKQEYFLCVSLNGDNEVITSRIVSVGLVNKTQVHPREVFADPITDRATAIIIAHNHPAGGLTPSKEDIEITRRLKTAGETLGIRLMDHIIFNQKDYYSFLEHEEM